MIRDLLWGCVVCHELESLRLLDRIETCMKCGAKYRRAEGAQISVTAQGRGVETRTAAEWTSQLPPITPTGSAECLVRRAEADVPVRAYGEYLGRIEKFGEFHFGQLVLTEQHICFDAREPERSFEWPLGELTGVQLSSTALQVKARRRPVVAIKFVNSSSRLWEERLQLALRKFYTGRDIVEFQPRICLR
ncbi:MAG TPA: hypothetical protein VGD49_11300 [Longimicrobiales bacterium]